ncbi:HAMP domain-containing protein [Pseudonocardia humida]|uniref:histidine kinase n=1 Tax=Pseudonocardia humida TaxID=2800819 RepID=A0ABT0ZX04_9PSEU|nr:HAMP domain-containing protein [Pseudonocardia humida]MCO1655241.1 HAMP domain-containing protein [Pseudonocardia humida]
MVGGLGARIGARVTAALTAAVVMAVVLVLSGVGLIFLVGTSLEDRLDETAQQAVSDTLVFDVLIAVPVLIVVSGLVFYLFAGQPLGAVESLRARAASAVDPDRPLPEPAGQDEVARLAETMNALLGRLEEARAVQHRLAATGHELRAPLSALGNGLDQIQRGQLDRSAAGALRSEVDRLGKVVDALLSGTAPQLRRDDTGHGPEHHTAPVSTTASGGMPAVRPRAAAPGQQGPQGKPNQPVHGQPDQSDTGEATTVINPLPRGPQDVRPVRDEDAREDPVTAPRGIPIVRPSETTGPRQRFHPQGPPGPTTGVIKPIDPNLPPPGPGQQNQPNPPNQQGGPRGGGPDRRGGHVPTDPRGTPTRGQSR